MTTLRTMSPEPVKPHRLSLSEILTLMLARGSERESVALGRSARGETTIDVVSRTRDAETLADAERRAREVYDRLRASYPMSSGYVGAVSDPKPADGGNGA